MDRSTVHKNTSSTPTPVVLQHGRLTLLTSYKTSRSLHSRQRKRRLTELSALAHDAEAVQARKIFKEVIEVTEVRKGGGVSSLDADGVLELCNILDDDRPFYHRGGVIEKL